MYKGKTKPTEKTKQNKTKNKTKQNKKITTTKQNKNKKYIDAVFPYELRQTAVVRNCEVFNRKTVL